MIGDETYSGALSRVRRIAMNSVTLAEYDYLGLSHVVGVDHPEPDIHANLFDAK